MDRIETAFGDKDEVIRFGTLRVKKLNRTTWAKKTKTVNIIFMKIFSSYVLNGNYTLLMPIENFHIASGAAFNLQGGQYKKMGDNFVTNLCEGMYNESTRSYFESFQASQSNPVPWNTCPYPSGPNTINNMLIDDYARFLPPYIPGSERWKLQTRLGLTREKILGGYNFYIIIRNQNSLLDGK